jgi:nitroreductase
VDISAAIQQRKSIRAFKPDPIPEATLRQVLEQAARAPSWANTQPWECAIASGPPLEQIKRDFVEKARVGVRPATDLAAPVQFPEPYDTRRRSVGRKIFELTGIGRENPEERAKWGLRALQLFGAPCCIYILTGRSFVFQGAGMNVWPVFDCGLVAENIMLIALEYGLGTIPEIQAVAYPDILRQVLHIPDSSLLVLGIAIGYPEDNNPVNQLRSEREPLARVTTWHGFGQGV